MKYRKTKKQINIKSKKYYKRSLKGLLKHLGKEKLYRIVSTNCKSKSTYSYKLGTFDCSFPNLWFQ